MLEGSEEEPGTVMKRFSLPDRVRFAVSAEAFAIVDRHEDPGPARRQEAGTVRRRGDSGWAPRDSASAGSPSPGIKVAGPAGAGGGETRLLSVSPWAPTTFMDLMGGCSLSIMDSASV